MKERDTIARARRELWERLSDEERRRMTAACIAASRRRNGILREGEFEREVTRVEIALRNVG
jgi:hypothetical protein